MTTVAPNVAPTPPGARRASGWLLVEGALLILLGVAAIAFPALAGVAAGVLFAWILIVIGIAGLVSALQSRPHVHLGWSLASSVLAIVAGLIVAFFPLAGTLVLVVVVAAWLVLDGISSLMIGLHLKRAGRGHWVWPIVSAVADWILAGFALALGPLGGAVLIGVIVGIDLVFGGIALLALSRGVGRRPL